jgi:hypothetical protein
LRSEVVVRLVDVDGIVDHLCLNFLSIMGFRHLYSQGLGFTGQFTSITVFSQLVCDLIWFINGFWQRPSRKRNCTLKKYLYTSALSIFFWLYTWNVPVIVGSVSVGFQSPKSISVS